MGMQNMEESIIIEKVVDVLSTFGIEALNRYNTDKTDRKKLKERMKEYLESQQSINEICLVAEEMDFQGFVEYVQANLLDDLKTGAFDADIRKRKMAIETIASKAKYYSHAVTEESSKRVICMLESIVDLIKRFYHDEIPMVDLISSMETADAVSNNVIDSINSLGEHLVLKMDEDTHRILESRAYGSVDQMMLDTEKGDMKAVGKRVSDSLKCISIKHPLEPDYGYDYMAGKIVSVPLTETAKEKYPIKYSIAGRLKEVGAPFLLGDDKKRADPPVFPVLIEVEEAKRFLGDKEDPGQSGLDDLVGKECLVMTPEMAQEYPCSVIVDDVVYYEYIILKLDRIEDGWTYVFTNPRNEEGCAFEIKRQCFVPNDPELTLKEATDSVITQTFLSIHISDSITNTELLKFERFMKALSETKCIRIHKLGTDEDFLEGGMGEATCTTLFFNSVDFEIGFLERICDIEKFYGVSLDLKSGFFEDDYNIAMNISNLLRGKSIEDTWEGITLLGMSAEDIQDIILNTNGRMDGLAFPVNDKVSLFGQEIELCVYKILKSVVVKEFDKVKTKAESLLIEEVMDVVLMPGEDNSLTIVLQLPKECQ